MNKVALFRLGFTVLPRIPHRLLQWLAVAAGYAMWALAAGTRTRVRANLAHMPHLAADSDQLDRAVRGCFRSLMLSYVDLFAPPRDTGPAFIAQYPVPQGIEQFQAARDNGVGCILLAVHGNGFEWGRYRLPLLMAGGLVGPMETLQPPELYDLVATERSKSGVRFLPVTESETLRELIVALRRGDNVLLALDRDVLHSGIEMPFFGATARIPTGAIALARMTGARIILVFPWRLSLDRLEGVIITPQAQVTRETRGDEAVRAALEPLVRVMETELARHPDLWLGAFASDIWLPEAAQVAEGDHIAVHSL